MGISTSSQAPHPPCGGGFPLVEFAGTAYDCGRQYGEFVVARFPGYRKYLDLAHAWRKLPPETARLFADRAPFLVDLHRGIADTAGSPTATNPDREASGCTSFAVSGKVTADGHPLSGQNKDTLVESVDLYLVLRLRIEGGPAILILAYPGEVLGYGFWSTGMSLFRNELYSRASADHGLSMIQWGLLALASGSVPAAVELAERHGIAGSGNCLIADRTGQAASVEFNQGGMSIVKPRDGIVTHANHPEGARTAPLEQYPDAVEKRHSRHRATRLRQLLSQYPGRLTPNGVLSILADHQHHPRSLCRHMMGEVPGGQTTAAIVADPVAGILRVVRGQPCCNVAVTYHL